MTTAVRFPATVTRIDRFGPDVATYHLTYTGRRLRFTPGQFLHLALNDYDPSRHWPDSRPLSIASGSASDTLRLTISRQGGFSRRVLDEVKIGDRLWLKGPYGELVVAPQQPGDRIILIAGGTGITPFCAFMEDLLSSSLARRNSVTLYYGARVPELLVYRELADRCAREVAGFSVVYYVEATERPTWVVGGRLDMDRIAADQDDPQKCLFYLSGPKLMIDAFSTRLKSHHRIAPERVLVDAWE